jgi:hypothetical protein
MENLDENEFWDDRKQYCITSEGIEYYNKMYSGFWGFFRKPDSSTSSENMSIYRTLKYLKQISPNSANYHQILNNNGGIISEKAVMRAILALEQNKLIIP